LYYHLPELYQNNLYGFNFLNYNYCYNNHGRFVFSFPADTNIYETDLAGCHVAYYAKSRFHSGNITPVSKEELQGNDAGYKQYKLRDSYGPVYFDPFRKRYLRLAKQKISAADYTNKKLERKESVIVFNENFKIIGELEITDDFAFSTLFFTSNGDMYARVKPGDEYALHFVRLEYKEDPNKPSQLTKVETNLSK
jgi:hypothetical protein